LKPTRVYVTGYWNALGEFSEVTLTTALPVNDSYLRNASTSIRHSTKNNIFLNSTLYGIYTSFMTDTVIPLLDMPLPARGIAALDPELAERYIVVETFFIRTLFRKVRRLKSPFVAIVAFAVAEYAFINAGYNVLMLIATWYQKRNRISEISNVVN
jgi:hypothetical protein